jgi:hypothetical protein
VPASVTIPAGAAATTFAIGAIDNNVEDGNQTVTITASAATASPATATVLVRDNDATKVVVVVRPSAVTLRPRATQQYSALVTGADNAAVLWTVQEGAAGGLVDKAGAYIAPSVPGVYHVVATSAVDPRASGRATVTVALAAQQVAFSGAVASAAANNLTLVFVTGLDASATDAAHYSVAVDTHLVTVQSAAYDARRHAVTLDVAAGALHLGDPVTVTWSGLRSATGAALADGAAPVVAR